MSLRIIVVLALVALCAANPVKRESLEHDDPVGYNVGKSTSPELQNSQIPTSFSLTFYYPR